MAERLAESENSAMAQEQGASERGKTMQVAGEAMLHALRFWGKSGLDENGEAAWHPLQHHSLDVAAVGSVLLEQNQLYRRRLREVFGLDEETLLSTLPFLLSLHDVGKFADGFQALREDLMRSLQGEARNPGYPERHDTLGFWFWKQRLAPDLLDRNPRFLQQSDRIEREHIAAAWFAAIAGHHGRPPKAALHLGNGDLRRQFPRPVEGAARAFVLAVERLLAPAGLTGPAGGADDLERRIRRSSHWLAGWATTADWIGSNREWFRFCTLDVSLDEYWVRHARPRAEKAVRESGIAEVASRPACGFREMWPHPEWSPSPLQAMAESISLGGGPQLFLFEDVTGAGKTEAALLLAHRLIAAGQAAGLYFALPTMATANAMHRRVSEMYVRLFADGERASLVLAHSRRNLFLPLEETRVDLPYATERENETTASLDCSAWLADSRKKALLAQVGVGTIDQALISVLPIRHQCLRLAGLAGKVLLVDEVHACDSYVGALLEQVLEFHAAFGGSAILLSATLPRRQREKFFGAFARGRGQAAPELKSQAYPLLTQYGPSGAIERDVSTRDSARRTFLIRAFRTEEEAEAWLLEACAAGGCACWVRNTVRDAMAAYDRLVARWGEELVMLFHSRFTVADRRSIEDRVLESFGPKSGAGERRGKLLVATQVVEQSLDLDFDAMATDLAPIDLVIQRAGRMRRHARNRAGNRSDHDDRGDAVLGVLGPGPTPEPSAEWFSRFFPTGAYVYADHGRLWLTAKWLESSGRLAMPEDARDAIEAVYGEESEAEIPHGLERAALAAEGVSQADKSLAIQNALRLDAGYAATMSSWIDDSVTPTRLGEETTVLRLAKRTAAGLEPYAGVGGAHDWEASEVSVLRRNVAAEAEDPLELESVRVAMRDRGRYSVIVILAPSGAVWRGRARDARGAVRHISYSGQRGLSVERTERSA